MNKIVFVMPSLKTGGGNRVFFELANCLVKLNYKVDVVYPFNSNEGNTFIIDKQINITRIGMYKNKRFNKIINFIKVINHIKGVYKNTPIIISDPLLCLFIKKFKNNAFIYRFIQADDYRIFDANHIFNSLFMIKFYKFLCRKSYSAKINYIFNSKFTYDSFCEVSKRKDVPYLLVYPAINHKIFFNQRNIIRDKELSICVVGRQHKWKGLSTFETALDNLPKYVMEMISHIYIISHDDLLSFNFPSNVLIINPKNDDEISKYYNMSNIFVSTSWWEGFGLPALEAMACGCSIITSDNKGCREYAFKDKNALFFEPKNVEELIICLVELIANEKLRKKLAKEAEKTALEFSWEESTKQLLRIVNNEM